MVRVKRVNSQVMGSISLEKREIIFLQIAIRT